MPRRSIGQQQVESGGNRNRFLERSREHWNHLPVSPWQRWSSRTKRIVTQDWSSPIMLPRCKSVTLQVRKLLHSHTVTGFEHYNLTLWLRMGLLNTSRLRSSMKDNFTSTKEVVATSCGPAISELLANQSAQTWALLQVRTLSIQGYCNIAKTNAGRSWTLLSSNTHVMNMLKRSKDEVYGKIHKINFKWRNLFCRFNPCRQNCLRFPHEVPSSSPPYFKRIQSCDEFAGPTQLLFLT